MINSKDQEGLLNLVADYIKKDITCLAIGGTAMMFKGYKETTKDIDLVFQTDADRKIFVDAIMSLGYRQNSLFGVYSKKQLIQKDKPVMYSRGQERFDLFVQHVFGIPLSFDLADVKERIDFIKKNELILFIPRIENIFLLKSVTNREKDFEDMLAIVKKNPQLDWNYITGTAVKHTSKNSWILVDLEEKMQRLRKVTFIRQEYFDLIYKAAEKTFK